MLAIQYVKSVPRYLAVRYLGRRFRWIYTSPASCIRLTEIDPPRLPGADWMRVRTILSGICGSDIATITASGSAYFSPFTSFPFVLGHEVVGEVIEVGRNVLNFKAGDRVVLEPPLGCKVRGISELCPQCRTGREALCENITRGDISAGIQTGFCRDTGGGWSPNFVAHHTQMHPVPPQLSSEEAVLIEPLGCALHAVRKAPLDDDQNVLVLGCGTMGLLTIAAIRGLGSRCRILATAKYPHQKELARELGADLVLSAHRSRALYAELASLLSMQTYHPELGPPVLIGGVDVCFDCVGSDRTIDDALRFTRSRGLVILVGMPAIPQNIDWTSIWYKELQVAGSYTSDSATFERAIQMMTNMQGKLKKLVGAKFSLSDYKRALQCALNSGQSKVVKTVFEVS